MSDKAKKGVAAGLVLANLFVSLGIFMACVPALIFSTEEKAPWEAFMTVVAAWACSWILIAFGNVGIHEEMGKKEESEK